MECDPEVPECRSGSPADVRTILPAEKLTHRVIHLEARRDALREDDQRARLSPVGILCGRLALQRHDLDADIIKEVYFFEYLLRQNATRAGPLSPGHCRRLERRYAHDAV